MNKRKFETSMILSLFLVIILLSGALAVVLYTLTKQSSWRVNVQYGLALTDQNDIPVTTLDFIVDRYGTQVKTFKIKNTSNNAVNVTQVMPNNTAYYSFATSFVNSTIVKDGFVLFTISLTDLNMNAELLYTGQFDWKIVDYFSVTYEPKVIFNSTLTEITYKFATATYLQYVGNSFDKIEYGLGEVVEYSFSTKDIYADSGNVIAWQYSLYIEDSSHNTVATIKDHYTVACNMSKNDIWTENLAFNAPLTEGTYHMNLVYELADYQPPPLVYTFVVTEIENGYQSDIMNVVVTGFTLPNQLSTIHFQIRNTSPNPPAYTHRYNWEVRIVQTGYVIKTGDTGTLSHGETWTSGTYSFYSPIPYGAYTIQITTWDG